MSDDHVESPFPSQVVVAAEVRPLITHYGLFWSAADVLWAGVKGGPGHLRGRERTRLERTGRPTQRESERAKDFSSFVGVYCLYRSGRIVYVGEAGLGNNSTLFRRLIAHRSDHLADLWDEFSWFGRSSEGSDKSASVLGSLAQLEAVLIAVVNPGSNKQSGTFSGAKQVFQVPHEKAEGDFDTKLARLMKKLEDIEKLITPVPPPKKRGRKPKGISQ